MQMDSSKHTVRAELGDIEQAAETVTFSTTQFIDALKRFLDVVREYGGQEIPVAALKRFGQSLTLVGDDLVEAGNETLSRIAGARDAG
jgi:hypothetical protein